jgi:hypothetical protein
MLLFKTCGSSIGFCGRSVAPSASLSLMFLGIVDANLSIAARSDLRNTFKEVNELESDLARAMDYLEILQKQAHYLHPL